MSHASLTIMEHHHHHPPDHVSLSTQPTSADADMLSIDAFVDGSNTLQQPSSTSTDAAQFLVSLKGSHVSPSSPLPPTPTTGHLTAILNSPLPRRRHSLSSSSDVFETENRYPDPKALNSQPYSNNIESRNFSPNTGSKRQQVKNACINCQKACKKCDDQRPCSRCVKYHIESSCTDSTRKERKKGIKRGPYKRKFDETDSSPSRLTPHLSSTSSPRDSYHAYFRGSFDNTPTRMPQPLLPNLPRHAMATEATRYPYEPSHARFSSITTNAATATATTTGGGGAAAAMGLPYRYASPYSSSSGGGTRSPSMFKGPYGHLVESKSSQYHRASTTSPMSSAPGMLPSLSELRYPESHAHSHASSSPYHSGWYGRSDSGTGSTLSSPFPPASAFESSMRGHHHHHRGSSGSGVASNFFSTHSSSPLPIPLQSSPYDPSLHRTWSPGSHFRSGSHAGSSGSGSISPGYYSPSGFSRPFQSSAHVPSHYGSSGYPMMASEEEGSRRHSRTMPSTLYTHSPIPHPHLSATATHAGSTKRSGSLLKLPPLVNTAEAKFSWESKGEAAESQSEQEILAYPTSSISMPRSPKKEIPSIESYMRASTANKLAPLLSDEASLPSQQPASSRGLDELSEICSVEIDTSGTTRSLSNRRASAT